MAKKKLIKKAAAKGRGGQLRIADHGLRIEKKAPKLASLKATSKVQSPKSKMWAPSPRMNLPARAKVRTINDRLAELPRLPSLKAASPAFSQNGPQAATVEVTAGPPPPTVAPPKSEPNTGEFVDRGLPIPDQYGLDRLVVLPRDSQWLYVYWELKGGALDRLRFQHSAEIIDNARWVLEVHALGDRTRYWVDVDVRSSHWYLKVSPDARFKVDLGFVSQQGELTPVLHGNAVSTPRPSVSPRVDEGWMVTREELERLLRASGAQTVITGSQPEEKHQIERVDPPRAFALFSGRGALKP